MKIVTVVGARPQFIKASALSREIKKHPEIHEVIIHTGQHFDDNMSEIFFREMEIPVPKYNLNIHSLSHGSMTGRMLEGIEVILNIEKPDFILVYGDTNSTLAGALAAKKLNLKVAHVEAGLRSFDMNMPEEINRILTDRISDILFCPTDVAVQNLKKEGYDNFNSTIIQCGDIMYDAALFYKSKAELQSTILKDLGLQHDNYVLATFHRQENTDNLFRLRSIVEALNIIHQECQVVVPMHPRTLKIIENQKIEVKFIVINPIGYLDMIALTSNASIVATDSGGLQKEAYFFGKYCLTLRDQTEWIELVDGGYNTLTGAKTASIIKAYHQNSGTKKPFEVQLYGDGHTAKKIVESLLK